MSRSVNKVILIGNLGQDPEMRYTGGNTAVCNMRIATSDSYKDANGQQVEKTEWHSVVAWGRLAEICGEYLKKGSQAYFEGSLQTRQWQDREGQTRYTTEVKVQNMMLLGSAGGGRSFSTDDDMDQTRGARQGGRPNYGSGPARQTAPAEGANREQFDQAFGPTNDESFGTGFSGGNKEDDLPF